MKKYLLLNFLTLVNVNVCASEDTTEKAGVIQQVSDKELKLFENKAKDCLEKYFKDLNHDLSFEEFIAIAETRKVSPQCRELIETLKVQEEELKKLKVSLKEFCQELEKATEDSIEQLKSTKINEDNNSGKFLKTEREAVLKELEFRKNRLTQMKDL
jgi:tRNA C32,U32 (ribose-2'-O)-methylase TrmJ